MQLRPVDLMIVVGYFAAMVGLGVWLGRKGAGTTNYFLGDRELPSWALLLSIVATETSSVTFLSVPGQAYAAKGDLRFLQLAIGLILGKIIVAVLFLPAFFRGQILTAYQVLQERFGGAVQTTASGIFLVMRTLADGLRLYLTAIVVNSAFGLDLNLCILALGITTILYTLFGGMKAVVWADVVQFVVYLIGALLAAWMIVTQIPGGLSQLITDGMAAGKWRVIVPEFDLRQPYTLWSGLIGGAFLTLTTHGTDQMMVQRYLSARSQREASMALVASGFVILAQFAMFLAIGVGLWQFYRHSPPAVPFKANDAVFADFIIRHMPPGAVGLTVAAIFAAAFSGSLNASAAAFVNDFYLKRFRERPSEAHLVAVSKVMTILFGLAQILVGIAGEAGAERSVVDQVLTIAGQTAGLILGIFLLGTLTRRVSGPHALTGLLTGAVVVLVLGYTPPAVAQRLFSAEWVEWGKTCFPIAGTWFALIGSLSTVTAGLLASVLWPSRRT